MTRLALVPEQMFSYSEVRLFVWDGTSQRAVRGSVRGTSMRVDTREAYYVASNMLSSCGNASVRSFVRLTSEP